MTDKLEKRELADGKLWKAVFALLGELSQYEETTDVYEQYRQTPASTPDITISKSAIREERKETAKATLMRRLWDRQDIAHVWIKYDGLDDSRNVDLIEYRTIDGKTIEAEELDHSVEEYVFAVLPGGWESDDGSFGSVEIDVTTGVALVIHTQRIVGVY